MVLERCIPVPIRRRRSQVPPHRWNYAVPSTGETVAERCGEFLLDHDFQRRPRPAYLIHRSAQVEALFRIYDSLLLIIQQCGSAVISYINAVKASCSEDESLNLRILRAEKLLLFLLSFLPMF